MKPFVILCSPILVALLVLRCTHELRNERFGVGLEPLTIEELVLVAAIEATHRTPAPLTQSVPYCVSFADSNHAEPVPGPELSRLPVSVYLIPVAACPPTYTSMIAPVDSLGRTIEPRPQGYIDPYYLKIWRPVVVSGGLTTVRIEASQGTRGWLIECEVRIPDHGETSCKTLSAWIS